MTLIRVDPNKLRSSAAAMDSMAGEAHSAASKAIAVTAHAPSYDGQFGPAVQAIGAEAAARLDAIAGLLTMREEYLTAKSIAFEEADNAVVSGMGSVPTMVIPNYFPFKFPQWFLDLVAFIVSMFPGGDLLDILKQLGICLTGGEVDDLVLVLALVGLLMDAGYLTPTPDGEVGNAAAAILKLIVKKIPNGPARDAIAKIFIDMVKNPKELGRVAGFLTDLVKRTDVLTALATKHPDLFAKLLSGGPGAMEALLRQSDDAIVKYLDDIAARGPEAQEFFEALVKNPQALEVALRQSPEVLDKLARYGDDGIKLIARYQDDMLQFLARTADPAGDLALRTTRAMEAAEELRSLGPTALDVVGPTRARALVDQMAEAMTHGSGDRMVLGKWEPGGGYVDDAIKNGGVYYENPTAMFEALGKNKELSWSVNEQYLRNQLEAGVSRVDFVGDIRHTLETAPTTVRAKEINFLLENASEYGYELVGNSWVKIK